MITTHIFQPEALWPFGIAILFVALIWGMLYNRGRNRANDRVTEAATRDLYADPAGYEAKRKKHEQDIRPS